MMITHANPAPAPLASDDVLAILAHELRDPLGALLCALDALPRDVDPDVRRAHSIAQRQARRVVQIVDALPLTATGKVHKDVLRDQVAGLPGREAR